MSFKKPIEVGSCFVCESTFRFQLMRTIDTQRIAEIAEMHLFDYKKQRKTPVLHTDKLCSNCQRRAVSVISEEEKGNNVTMQVVLQPGYKFCLICGSPTSELHDISRAARIQVYIDTGKYIVQRSRCCQSHLSSEGKIMPIFYDGLNAMQRQIIMKTDEFTKWLQDLRNVVRSSIIEYHDEGVFKDNDFKVLTGVSKANFLDMFSCCKPVTINNKLRKVHKRDLIMFLVKMRQGLSDDFLNVMFKYTSRQAISIAITTVRMSLMENFVLQHLGLSAISRDDYIHKHVTDFSTALYNPDADKEIAIITIDGTYLYIPKCSNYRALRQSYSMHKGRHLIKPVMLTAPDGYILDVHGPYFADSKNNDASLLVHNLKRDLNGLKAYLQEEDLLIVDRGYRDSLEFLNSIGVNHKMPGYLPKGNKQHTAEEANSSRLVTKTRWIVESRNGHIKSMFRFLRDTIPMPHVPNLGDFFRIACAIINAYSTPILMKDANPTLAQRMLDLAKQPNVLQAKVEQDRLEERKSHVWFPMDAKGHLPGFPKLTEDYLRDLTVGVYQIKLARSYVQDKLHRDSEYTIDVLLEEPGLLRARIFSRFRQSCKYYLWIAYDDASYPSEEEEEDEVEPILGWYCKCKTGARTLGCCAHVASVLWYMGYARHQDVVKYPSTSVLRAVMDAGEREAPLLHDVEYIDEALVGIEFEPDN